VAISTRELSGHWRNCLSQSDELTPHVSFTMWLRLISLTLFVHFVLLALRWHSEREGFCRYFRHCIAPEWGSLHLHVK
jgi:hypothetical protein